MSRSTLDKILGFVSGALAMGIVALIVGVTYIESSSIGLYAVVLAISALLTLLMLRGIPIDQIKVGDRVTIDFQIKGDDDE